MRKKLTFEDELTESWRVLVGRDCFDAADLRDFTDQPRDVVVRQGLELLRCEYVRKETEDPLVDELDLLRSDR